MMLRAAAVSLVFALSACADHGPKHASTGQGEEGHAVGALSLVTAPSEAEIAALFDTWNDTLQNGSPHDMAMLYAEDGVLLPTVSNQPRSNRPEMTDYFEHFQKLSPRGVINEQYIQVLDANTAVNSGIYTFDVVRAGQADFVVARYNFIYEKVGGKWLIKSHHSSAMPEPMEGRPQSLAERRGARVHYAAAERVAKPTDHPAPSHTPPGPKDGHGDDHGAKAGHH